MEIARMGLNGATCGRAVITAIERARCRWVQKIIFAESDFRVT